MRRSPLNPSRSLSKLVPERAGGIAGGYGAFIPHLLRIRGGIWGFLGHDPGSIAGVKWLGKILGKIMSFGLSFGTDYFPETLNIGIAKRIIIYLKAECILVRVYFFKSNFSI
jgi:hypothetical protein